MALGEVIEGIEVQIETVLDAGKEDSSSKDGGAYSYKMLHRGVNLLWYVDFLICNGLDCPFIQIC